MSRACMLPCCCKHLSKASGTFTPLSRHRNRELRICAICVHSFSHSQRKLTLPAQGPSGRLLRQEKCSVQRVEAALKRTEVSALATRTWLRQSSTVDHCVKRSVLREGFIQACSCHEVYLCVCMCVRDSMKCVCLHPIHSK